MLNVIIIGGGVCGCSLLYELSRYRLDVVLLEEKNDVGVATTKANSAIVHAGYDPPPDTLMARYNVEGNRLIEQLCKDLDILYRKTGSLMLGFNDADRALIEILYNRGLQNGVPGLRIIESAELHTIEPALSPEAKFALHAPSAGIVSPWELAFAQAEAAVQGGAQVTLDTQVYSIEKIEKGFLVHTTNGTLKSRFVVNAAGIHSAEISAMLGEHDFSIQRNRGEYFLLDTTQGQLVRHIIFQTPTSLGKGVLVSPTVHGNLIVGPNAKDVVNEDISTTRQGLDYVRSMAVRSVPGINFRDTIRNFAGLRAQSAIDDFIVGPSTKTPGYFRMAGIKSPGLSSAPAIAKDLVRQMQQAGLGNQPNPGYCSTRRILRFKSLDAVRRDEVIRQNPLYGTIVCRCQTVTEGEIVDALHRPLPPRSLDAVKRRVGPGMGRCQGGFCGPRVQSIIARELDITKDQVPQDYHGMNIITGCTKAGKGGEKT
jgi:Predicted dehydrogenase